MTNENGQGGDIPGERTNPERISIKPMKDLVLSQFPPKHPLRDVILAEKDTMTRDELTAKMEVWVILSESYKT